MISKHREYTSAYSKKSVGYIHAHINSITDNCEINEVTPSEESQSLEYQLQQQAKHEPDQPQSDKVMCNKCNMVFTRLL